MGDTSLTCEKFFSQLKAYFENCLDPVQDLRMERHLDACVTCRAVYEPQADERLRSCGIFEMFPAGDFEGCLSIPTLEEYRAGRLTNAEELDLIREHLAECPLCNRVDIPQKPNQN